MTKAKVLHQTATTQVHERFISKVASEMFDGIVPVIGKVTLDTDGMPIVESSMRRRNGQIVTVREHIINLPVDVISASRHFMKLFHDALATPAVQEEIQFANDYVRQLKSTNPDEFEVQIGVGIECQADFDIISESVVVFFINTAEGDESVEDILTLDEFIRLFPMH